MDRQPVQSSLIKSIGFADGEMHIEFEWADEFERCLPAIKLGEPT